MPRVDTASKTMAIELLRSYWKPEAIAEEGYYSLRIIYRWERNIHMYGGPNRLRLLRHGPGRRIHTTAKESLFAYQRRNPWAYQDELAMFLEEEWDIRVSKPIICRLLKEHGLSRKHGQRVGHT